MEKKILYRVNRSDGGVSITPDKPTDRTYTETYRLIADEGMILTDGTNTFPCIDTNEPSKYTEVSESEDEYSQAGKILLGVAE